MSACQGTTKDGRPCSRPVKDGALYCWQHGPDEPETRLVDDDGMPLPEVYELLENATPEEKADIVLRLIEEHPEGRLELSARDRMRADLHRVNLNPDTLKTRVVRLKSESPAWWDDDRQSAKLRGANLHRAILESARLQGADLRGADLRRADLRGADLRGANLQGADLQRVGFQAADLWNTNFQGAILRGADLRGARLRLGGTNFRSADLRDARLQEIDLSRCIITHIYISGAWLDRNRLRREQLGGAIGEELDGDFRAAKLGYLTLKQNFDGFGDYDAASWAYRKERRMEKLEARQNARRALSERKWRAAAAYYAKFASDQLVEWISDYGESIPRVLYSLLVVYVLFALIYGLTWGVMRAYDPPSPIVREPTRNLVDLALFSLGAMTTMDPVGLEPRTEWVQLLAGLEALLGIALTGLLGFVLGNRIRRS